MADNEFLYRHGKYTFCINIENIEDTNLKKLFAEAIDKQFGSFLQEKDSQPLLTFFLVENLQRYFQVPKYENIGSIKYYQERLWYNKDGLNFVYTKSSEGHSLFVKIDQRSSWKSNCRLLNKGFNNGVEMQIAVLYYRIFLVFSQLLNIENGTTYIHGATVANESGDATLFPADSGVGKSSMLFRMANEKKFHYVADDLSIVSADGKCFYAGRAISTKPYHLKNFPFLKELVEKKMPLLQKLQWTILQDNRLLYSLNPKDLFHGRVKRSAQIKTVVHLINTSEKDFSIETAQTQTLAKASANILMNELMLGYQIFYRALAIPGNSLLISPGEIYRKSLQIYMELYSDCDLYILKVPYMSHPDLMYDYLIQKNILK